MLLPHGYEGQGPEHSSARLERYLQLCANNNIFVVNITTPANFFHALRRQLHLGDRKPLVVMSPKSILRNPLATSSMDDFTGNTKFEEIFPETEKLAADDKIKKVVLCSGKIYYELLTARNEAKINDIALIRLEQLYPFPKDSLQKELKRYKNAQVIWCQEEPKNMGSWSFINELVEEALVEIKHKNTRPKFVGRIPSASTATGYGSYHAKEQKTVIEEALK
jgi:2-oxoglutarate dehydrogenase E1 component